MSARSHAVGRLAKVAIDTARRTATLRKAELELGEAALLFSALNRDWGPGQPRSERAHLAHQKLRACSARHAHALLDSVVNDDGVKRNYNDAMVILDVFVAGCES